MNWVEQIKNSIPDHAKDIRLNLDAVINRSGLDEVDAHACALAAAIAAGNGELAFEIQHTKITFFAVAWQVIFLFFIHFNLLSVLVLHGKYYYLLGFQLGVFRCVLLGLCL